MGRPGYVIGRRDSSRPASTVGTRSARAAASCWRSRVTRATPFGRTTTASAGGPSGAIRSGSTSTRCRRWSLARATASCSGHGLGALAIIGGDLRPLAQHERRGLAADLRRQTVDRRPSSRAAHRHRRRQRPGRPTPRRPAAGAAVAHRLAGRRPNLGRIARLGRRHRLVPALADRQSRERVARRGLRPPTGIDVRRHAPGSTTARLDRRRVTMPRKSREGTAMGPRTWSWPWPPHSCRWYRHATTGRSGVPIPDPWPQMREAAPSAKRSPSGPSATSEVERRRPPAGGRSPASRSR